MSTGIIKHIYEFESFSSLRENYCNYNHINHVRRASIELLEKLHAPKLIRVIELAEYNADCIVSVEITVEIEYENSNAQTLLLKINNTDLARYIDKGSWYEVAYNIRLEEIDTWVEKFFRK